MRTELFEFPIYHTETTEDCTWYVEYSLHPYFDRDFNGPIFHGDTSTEEGRESALCRVDYKGVPGQLKAVEAEGIATKLSEANDLRSGSLFVTLDVSLIGRLVHGQKYIRRVRQKQVGHTEWSVWHDEIIVW